MDKVEWSSLHKILNDTTRRSVLELLSERQALSYTEIMTLLQITNTGRLNYHLKSLGDLISKDGEGRYRLTERGQLAVNLLKTFPERAPAQRSPSALKITTAIVLILVGVLIVSSVTLSVISFSGPITVSGGEKASLSSQVIPQNATVTLTGWGDSGVPFSISWSASSPVYVYVLNQTQNDALLLQHPTARVAGSNFTGAPASWVDRYYDQTGNSTLNLPVGTYYFFAGSSSQTTLETFGYAQASQPQHVGTASVSPFVYLTSFVFIAIGALLIVLAFSILTKRVWR